ncbi:MAG: nicotinate-nucleotide--dimethylbenzimidazole phosphoribosyltransferase, partial [Candidatus Promineifilaceae bacterium]
KVGGFEIGGLVGVILGAAGRRIPVVLDGFITTAAALIAVQIAPMTRPYLIASHCSEEEGHGRMLAHLELEPLFNYGLRLGEGSGAALALPVIEAAARVLDEMATFAEAGVSEK